MKKYFVFLPLITSCNALHRSSVYKAKPDLESENNNERVSSLPSTSYSTNDLDNSSILCFREGENNYQHCLKNLYETKRTENPNFNIQDLNAKDVLEYIKSHMPNINELIENVYKKNKESQKLGLEALSITKCCDPKYYQKVLQETLPKRLVTEQKYMHGTNPFMKDRSCLKNMSQDIRTMANSNKLSDDLAKFHIDFFTNLIYYLMHLDNNKDFLSILENIGQYNENSFKLLEEGLKQANLMPKIPFYNKAFPTNQKKPINNESTSKEQCRKKIKKDSITSNVPIIIKNNLTLGEQNYKIVCHYYDEAKNTNIEQDGIDILLEKMFLNSDVFKNDSSISSFTSQEFWIAFIHYALAKKVDKDCLLLLAEFAVRINNQELLQALLSECKSEILPIIYQSYTIKRQIETGNNQYLFKDRECLIKRAMHGQTGNVLKYLIDRVPDHLDALMYNKHILEAAVYTLISAENFRKLVKKFPEQITAKNSNGNNLIHEIRMFKQQEKEKSTHEMCDKYLEILEEIDRF